MALPSGDPIPPIPLDPSNASTSPEIIVDATNSAEAGEDGTDLKTDATGYYGYGYSRYRPSFYNYYGNPYYNNYRYYGNYYPQNYYYPHSSYYSSEFFLLY